MRWAGRGDEVAEFADAGVGDYGGDVGAGGEFEGGAEEGGLGGVGGYV